MNIEISCELYSRLSAIPLLLDPEDKRRYFGSIYLERANNTLFAIVTNGKLAAIERIGDDIGPDECTAIRVEAPLIEQCEKEVVFNSKLVIVANPSLGYTAIKTTFGYNYPVNAMMQLPENNWFNTWRKWPPDEMPKETNGAMFWNGALIHALATASPSGGLCFPEFIDNAKPVVVRDLNSADWLGLFMPVSGEGAVDPATIPDWVGA